MFHNCTSYATDDCENVRCARYLFSKLNHLTLFTIVRALREGTYSSQWEILFQNKPLEIERTHAQIVRL